MRLFSEVFEKSSIEFTKKNQSITYIVPSIDDGELLGYFTIALKPLTVREETVSNTVKKKLLRISELDEETQTYTRSAYLIAQFGKNFTNGANTQDNNDIKLSCKHIGGYMNRDCRKQIMIDQKEIYLKRN